MKVLRRTLEYGSAVFKFIDREDLTDVILIVSVLALVWLATYGLVAFISDILGVLGA